MPKSVARDIEDAALTRSAIFEAIASMPRYRKPPTLRQRLMWRWVDYRDRMRLALDALHGTHDCGGWD